MTDLIVSITSKKLSKELATCEEKIRIANKSFLDIGDALTVISDGKLYKERNFPTFELYVNTIFDFTRDYAYKIMSATRIYHVLAKNFKPSELPRAETHCRPLTKIEKDEDVLKIWANVVATNKIIAKTVTEMVNQHLGKGQPTDAKAGKPEPDTENTSSPAESGSVQEKVEQVENEISNSDQIRILEAKIVSLENELEKARSMKGGVAKSKMARQMIQAGFKALSNSIDDDQMSELIATKKALLG